MICGVVLLMTVVSLVAVVVWITLQTRCLVVVVVVGSDGHSFKRV